MSDIDPADAVASLTDVVKSYRMDAVTVPVLRGVNLSVRLGHFTVVLGPSGSGKTTMLNLLGCIDRPDEGRVVVAGVDIATLDDDELSDFRAENIGFVFQNFNLIPVLSAFENVEYPLVLAGMEPARRRRRVMRLLEAVGLEGRANNLPGQLSGGQRQRVAIARALARKPKVVIADEPTANLDSKTGAAIIALMRWMQQKFHISFIFSSHDSSLIKAADDLILLRDGAIQSVRRKPASVPGDNAELAGDFDDLIDGDARGSRSLKALPDTAWLES
ncbi:MAG TPA: ABC transporter ATP-binding protein [Rubrivivax sp.]|nr:ABC transporter ATP-binding protein [Burkholderiales bacterium]HNU10166.1 ABC transporter ATP-binding protein [Rubrivivax sp.]